MPEMEMRQNEKMSSRSTRGGRQNVEKKKKKKKQLGGEESELLQNPQTCLDLLKALCQHIGFNLANTATWPLSFLSTGEKKIVINWQLRIESNLSEEVWGKKSESVWHNP